MIVVKNKADCCGCTACYSVCPKKAISMQQDQEGFLYPFVEISKCIDCKLCDFACPIENKNNIMTAWLTLAEIDANPIMLAKIGVEQGVPIRAKTAPNSNGYRISLLKLFCGISFMMTGNSKSITSRIFNPIIKMIEATISVK